MVTKAKTKQTINVKTVDTPSDLATVNDSQLGLFDYSSLDANTAKLAKESAIEIKAREKAIWENIIEIGNRLIEVKNALPHGQFESWVKQEFGWDKSTSSRYMKIAEEIKPKVADTQLLPNSMMALYQLASALGKADEETKEEILTAVEEKTEEKGKALTEKEIKEITAKIKQEYEEKINQLNENLKEAKQGELFFQQTLDKKQQDYNDLLETYTDKVNKIQTLEETVNNQNKQIKELNSAISIKENELQSLENDKLELELKQRELDDLIAKEANVIVQQTLEQERQVLLKKEADLLKKEGQIKEELKQAESLKATAQRQKDDLDLTTEWIANFTLTNEFLQDVTNQMKKLKNNLQKNPDLSNLDEKNKAMVETKIKDLIVEFNSCLHDLGGQINYLNASVVKFNNHALRVLDAEVVNDD